MSAREAYRRYDQTSWPASTTRGRSFGAGLAVGLAFAFAITLGTLCALAWVNNEDVVAWSLSKGLVSEASAEGLYGGLRYAYGATAAAGLILASLALGTVRRAFSSGGSHLRAVIASILRHVKRCTSAVARDGLLVLGYAGQGAQLAAGYVRSGIAALVEGTGAVAGHVWTYFLAGLAHAWAVVSRPLRYVRLGIAAVATTVALTNLYLTWMGVSAIARRMALALHYVWTWVSWALDRVRIAFVAVVRYAALRIRYLWMRGATAAQVGASALKYASRNVYGVLAWVGAKIVDSARSSVHLVGCISRHVSRGLEYPWTGVSTLFGYLRAGARVGAQDLRAGLCYLLTLVSKTSSHLGEGVDAMADVGRVGLRYAWHGVNSLLRLLWVGVSSGLGFVWRVVTTAGYAASAAMKYAGQSVFEAFHHVWLGACSIVGYLWMGAAAVTQGVALTLKGVQFGVVAAARPVRNRIVDMARVIGTGMRLAWLVLTTVAGAVGSAVAASVGLLLYYILLTVSTAIGYVGLVAFSVVQAVSSMMLNVLSAVASAFRYLWVGLTLVMTHLWRGSSVIALAAGASLDYFRVGGASLFGVLWMGLSSLASILGLVLALARLLLYTALRYMRLGVATTFGVMAAVTRYAWWPISTFLTYVRAGATLLAHGIGTLLRGIWVGASALGSHLGLGLSTIEDAAGTVFHPLRLAASATRHHLGLGVATAFLVVGWTLVQVGKGMRKITVALIKSPVVLIRTLWIGFCVVPDAWRAFVLEFRSTERSICDVRFELDARTRALAGGDHISLLHHRFDWPEVPVAVTAGADGYRGPLDHRSPDAGWAAERHGERVQ